MESKEQLKATLSRLKEELRREEYAWNSAAKSDRYWIEQAIASLELRIERYEAKLKEIS